MKALADRGGGLSPGDFERLIEPCSGDSKCLPAQQSDLSWYHAQFRMLLILQADQVDQAL